MSESRRPSFAGPLRAVIFDWAGTTVDFGSLAPVRAVTAAFRRRDVALSLDEARGPMGKAKRDHLATLLTLPEVSARWRAVYGRPPTDGDVEEIYREFLPMQRELIAEHAALIPGCLEAVDACRSRGLKIGSTTGYTRELMDVLAPLARKQGFEPEATVVADDVPAGRPTPWMCFECARRLDVYPPAAIVVVDDTVVGVEAGRNAGMWTVGVVESGNLVGLSQEELQQLDPTVRAVRCDAARHALTVAGACFTIDTIAELPATLAGIDALLAAGEHP